MGRSLGTRVVGSVGKLVDWLSIIMDVFLIVFMIQLAKTDDRYLYCAMFAVPYNITSIFKIVYGWVPKEAMPEVAHALHVDGYLYKAMMFWCGHANVGASLMEVVLNYIGRKRLGPVTLNRFSEPQNM